MGDQIVSKPDHGEFIIQMQEAGGVASERFQLYLDDLTERLNSFVLGDGEDSGIFASDFAQSSVLYKPSVGTAVLPAIIDEQELLGRITGGEIAGLGFVDIWSILDDGTANVTLNEPGFAVNFRVESKDSSNMFLVDGNNNRVGMSPASIAPTDGILHIIHTLAGGGSQGTIIANTAGDDLVLEHDFFGGLSMLNGNNGVGSIYWGSPIWGNAGGQLSFLHDIDFGGVGAPAFTLDIFGTTFWTVVNDQVDGATSSNYFNPLQDANIDFQVDTGASTPFLKIDNVNDRIGISNSSDEPEFGLLHLTSGKSGIVTPGGPTDIVIETSTGCGIYFATPDLSQGRLTWGVPATGGKPLGPNRAFFQYNHNSDAFEWYFRGGTDLGMELNLTGEFVINPQTNVNTIYTLRVRSPNSDFLLNATSSIFNAGGRVGISDGNLPPTDGLLHIRRSDATASASNVADSVVIEALNGTGFGLSFLGIAQAAAYQNIFFGNAVNNNECIIRCDPGTGVAGTNSLEFLVDAAAVTALTIDAAEVVVNVTATTASTNFRVPSDTNTSLFLVDTLAASNRVGISDNSLAPLDGLLHIQKTGIAGVVTADLFSNSLVIESSASSGLSFLNADATFSTISFGSPTLGNDAAQIFFNHAATPLENLNFSVATIRGMSIFNTGVFMNLDQNTAMDFQVNTLNSAPFLRVISADNRMGLSQGVSFAATDGILHIFDQGAAGVVDANSLADAIVIEGNTGTGLSILTPDDGTTGNIYFGNPTNNNDGIITFEGVNQQMRLLVNQTVEILRINPTNAIFNEDGADIDFRVESDLSTQMILVDASLDLVSFSSASLAGTEGTVHIINADAGAITASGNSDELIIEGTGERGIQFLTDNGAGFANISYGDPSNGALSGQIRWDASAATLTFIQATRTNLTIAPLEVVVNDGSLSNLDFRVETDNNPKKLWVDASADTAYTRAGGSTSDTANARIGGYLNVDNTTQGTTAVTTEETLLSFSLPAFSMGVNGQGVRIKAWGTTAANGNNKTVRLKFGATNVMTTGPVASNNETWHFEAEVFRTGGATQDAVSFVSFFNGVITQAQITNPAETLTGAVTIAVSGQNGTAAANDIVAEGFTVEYIS